MTWSLAIDFGTSFTGAAVTSDGSAAQMVGLGRSGKSRMPSAVFLPDEWKDWHEFVVGDVAQSMAGTSITSYERKPKPLVAQGSQTVRRGGRDVRVVELVAAVLRFAHQRACTRQSSTTPDEVRLTHPEAWHARLRGVLLEAASLADIPGPQFVSEPVAAALYQASATQLAVAPGDLVAVYDLGGGTFDVAVLECLGGDTFEVRARGGDVSCGGELFDDLIIDHLGAEYGGSDAWLSLTQPELNPADVTAADNAAMLRLRVTAAKEELAANPSTTISIPGIGSHTLSQGELDELIKPHIDSTVDRFARTVRHAGVEPRALRHIFMAGGSSELKLVAATLIRRLELERLPVNQGDPQNAVALGASRWLAPEAFNKTLNAPKKPAPSGPQQPQQDYERAPDRPKLKATLAFDGVDGRRIVALPGSALTLRGSLVGEVIFVKATNIDERSLADDWTRLPAAAAEAIGADRVFERVESDLDLTTAGAWLADVGAALKRYVIVGKRGFTILGLESHRDLISQLAVQRHAFATDNSFVLPFTCEQDAPGWEITEQVALRYLAPRTGFSFAISATARRVSPGLAADDVISDFAARNKLSVIKQMRTTAFAPHIGSITFFRDPYIGTKTRALAATVVGERAVTITSIPRHDPPSLLLRNRELAEQVKSIERSQPRIW